MASKQAGYAYTDMVDWDNSPESGDIVLPAVKGWKILVLPLSIKTKTDGGIVIPDSVLDQEGLVMTIGKVLQVGSLAYTRPDMRNFETGAVEPWCKVGEFVVYGKYSGKKQVFKGVPLVYLNDDEIIAVLTP